MVFIAIEKQGCRKKTNIIMVSKTVEMRIFSSVATLEVHKGESGVETNC